MNPPTLATPRILIPFTVATLIWGSTWIIIRDQLGVVPPSWSVTYRFIIAAAGLFAWIAVTRAPLRLGRQGQTFAALFGLLQFMMNFNFVYRAEAHITSGLVAVIFALLIVPNSVLGALFLKQRLTARFLLGSLVALAGVGLLIVNEARGDPSTSGQTWLGLSLTVLGVLCASLANVMQGTRRAKALPIFALIAWGMVWGVLFDAVFAYATVGPPVIEHRLSYWFGTAYLGLFASSLAFACYFIAIRAVGPGPAAYSSVITPVLAMVLSTLFEDYRWTILAVGGGVLAFAGLLIALTAPKTPAKKPSPA
ncbi:MAG TPA: DMT family transporter [Sphingomonas sp.]|nr:DMT family transporter [Sphingomonas sp.]